MSFDTAYAAAKERGILIDEDRARGLHECAAACAHLDGEFWECGVYKGGSAKVIADVLGPTRTFRLFDTFAGLSGIDKSIDTKSCIHAGWLTYNDVEAVRKFIAHPNLPIHVGAIPHTFVEVIGRPKIAFAYIDVDLYQPTSDALKEILPRMIPGGIIVVDDYTDPDWPGVEKAIDDMVFWINGIVQIEQVGTQARIRL